MKRTWLLSFLFVFLGCSTGPRIASPTAIQVQALTGKPKVVQLDSTQSQTLIAAFSDGRKEDWTIFVPGYSVTLQYQGSEEKIEVGEQLFRTSKGTYRASRNLEALIASMMH